MFEREGPLNFYLQRSCGTLKVQSKRLWNLQKRLKHGASFEAIDRERNEYIRIQESMSLLVVRQQTSNMNCSFYSI